MASSLAQFPFWEHQEHVAQTFLSFHPLPAVSPSFTPSLTLSLSFTFSPHLQGKDRGHKVTITPSNSPACPYGGSDMLVPFFPSVALQTPKLPHPSVLTFFKKIYIFISSLRNALIKNVFSLRSQSLPVIYLCY